jgi:hypothetical protein
MMTIWNQQNNGYEFPKSNEEYAAMNNSDIRDRFNQVGNELVGTLDNGYHRPVYSNEDQRKIEYMEYRRDQLQRKMAEESALRRAEAERYMAQRASGPLGASIDDNLRTDIRIPSREAAANYARAAADNTPTRPYSYYARSDDGLDGHHIGSIMDPDFRWTDEGRYY